MSPGRAAANAVPVILDVDTGIDDALALLLAAKSPALDLLAVSCVSGNAGVDQVVRNTLKVLDAAGATDVSVARGADRPLLEPARDARHVHGEDGMGDLGWPDSERAPVDMHAIELMRLTLESAPRPVTLVPLAPMTNVALLLRAYPHVAEQHRADRVHGRCRRDRQRDRGGGVQRVARPGGRRDRPHERAAGDDVRARRLLRGDDRRGGSRTACRIVRRGGAARGPALQRQHGRHIATIGDAGAVAAVIEPEGSPRRGTRSGSSWPARGRAGRPSSTAGRGRVTSSTTRTGYPLRWSTWRSAWTLIATGRCSSRRSGSSRTSPAPSRPPRSATAGCSG